MPRALFNRPPVATNEQGRGTRFLAMALTVAAVAACTTLASSSMDEKFGLPDPTRFDEPTEPLAGESYSRDIQPILDRRCVVCHACYDAPCQLKTTSWHGLARGASKEPVYHASRLLAAEYWPS